MHACIAFISRELHSITQCASNNSIEWENVEFSDTLAENIVALQPYFSTGYSAVIIDNNLDLRCKTEVVLDYFTPQYCYSDETKLSIMKSIDRILEKVRRIVLSGSKELKSEPANKKIDKQRRLFSTVKKKSKSRCAEHASALRKPTINDRLNIKKSMRNPFPAIETHTH